MVIIPDILTTMVDIKIQILLILMQRGAFQVQNSFMEATTTLLYFCNVYLSKINEVNNYKRYI
jgi:hypothetical protein